MSKTEEEYCKHDLDLRWCATCLHGPRKKLPDDIVKTYSAKFPSRCAADCGDIIDKGADVVRTVSGGNYHLECMP